MVVECNNPVSCLLIVVVIKGDFNNNYYNYNFFAINIDLSRFVSNFFGLYFLLRILEALLNNKLFQCSFKLIKTVKNLLDVGGLN